MGSGPAAAGAVQALLDDAWNVTVLDVGNRLEEITQQKIDAIAKIPVEQWDAQDIEKITTRDKTALEAVNSKRIFGSNYPFDDRNNLLDIHWQGPKTFNHSLAFGGLSNIWGAAMLPYSDADITEWPITSNNLAPHYRAIMKHVPCTGDHEDDIETILPKYSEQANSLRLSRQGTDLLSDLQKNRSKLLKRGIISGKARLAIQAANKPDHDHCQYCGLCLSGCPYGLIYSTAHSFAEWIKSGEVTYLAEHLVEKVEQKPEGAIVHGTNLTTKEPFHFQADHIFIASGLLPTAKIVLQSRPDLLKPIHLLDSQYFIFPFLRFKSSGNVELERMHTSSQIFMEVSDPNISPNLVHLQFYGYSQLLQQEVCRTFLRFPLRWKPFRHWFFSRLMIVQGFIHSNESGHVKLSAKHKSDGSIQLLLKPVRAMDSLRIIFALGIKLLVNMRNLGGLLLLPGLKIPRAGASYHSGGSFPMKANPQSGETDSLGRLNGWKNIHIVDSSIFPSIPATSITMTSMANAHRIASMVAKDIH